MHPFDVAKATLKEIRDRVALTLDRLAETEKEIDALQAKNRSLNKQLEQEQTAFNKQLQQERAQLERERHSHQETKKQLVQLRRETSGETLIVHGIEFRRGVRTANKWTPFCPKCHLPIAILATGDLPYCNDSNCGWVGNVPASEIKDAAIAVGISNEDFIAQALKSRF